MFVSSPLGAIIGEVSAIDNIVILVANNSTLFNFTNSFFTTSPSTVTTESIVSCFNISSMFSYESLSIVTCIDPEISSITKKHIDFLSRIFFTNPEILFFSLITIFLIKTLFIM